MVAFFVNVLVLFAAQFAVGIIWYSWLFKNVFGKLESVNANVDVQGTKEVVGQFFKLQMLSNLVKAIFVALIVWIIPMSFGSYIVVLLFILAIPAILIGSNLRLGAKPMELVLLESGQLVAAYIVMFLFAFIIRAIIS